MLFNLLSCSLLAFVFALLSFAILLALSTSAFGKQAFFNEEGKRIIPYKSMGFRWKRTVSYADIFSQLEKYFFPVRHKYFPNWRNFVM